MILFWHSNGVTKQPKEPRNHQKGKHIEMKYYMFYEIVYKGDMVVEQILYVIHSLLLGQVENCWHRALKNMILYSNEWISLLFIL